MKYLPKIDLTGEWGETGLTPDRDATHAADAMVRISLPLWEGGRIAGDIKEKTGLNEEQKIKSDDLNWKIEEDVRVSPGNLGLHPCSSGSGQNRWRILPNKN